MSFCGWCARIWSGLLVATVLALAPADVQAEILVTVIGDSGIAGMGIQKSQAYPAKLEHALKARGYDVRVLNKGVNGDTTTGVLSRLNSAAPEGTKVAVVCVGINDLSSGIAPETIRANLKIIVDRLRARGIRVYVIKIPFLALLRGEIRVPKEYLLDGESAVGHLNAAGYDFMVTLTLAGIEKLVAQASKGTGDDFVVTLDLGGIKKLLAPASKGR
jgi:acyl-CoA thioesterase I